jgi:hypothetical protein
MSDMICRSIMLIRGNGKGQSNKFLGRLLQKGLFRPKQGVSDCLFEMLLL